MSEPDEEHDEDDVARLSESTARLTHLFRISPASYVPFLQRKDVENLHQLAPLVVILYHLPCELHVAGSSCLAVLPS